MIHFEQCPVCGKSQVRQHFTAKDHTVSQESFAVWQCNDCTAMFTQDIPDQQAIGAYYASENYISHTETQKGIINRLYHIIRKRTLNGKRDLVRKQTGMDKGDLLDVGCGTGAFLQNMQTAGWNITGLEPDETARKNAATLHGVHPLSPDNLFSFAENSFDAITLWHVLEHVHRLDDYVAAFQKILKPGGKLFIAVPNYTSFDATYYKEHWAAYDVPRHLYHFSPQSMRLLMQKHGMRVQAIRPMWFDSFYVSMLSETCAHGRGNIIRAFFTGLRSNIRAMGNNEKCSSLIYIISKA